MVTKVNKTWKGKNIAYLFLEATLIRCLHQFIDHKCTNWSRMKILKHKTIVGYLMLRQLQRHSLRYWSKAFYKILAFLTYFASSFADKFLFPLQCSISLSVLCPKKLPKLRAIYDAVTVPNFIDFSPIYLLGSGACLYCVEIDSSLFLKPTIFTVFNFSYLLIDFLHDLSDLYRNNIITLLKRKVANFILVTHLPWFYAEDWGKL